MTQDLKNLIRSVPDFPIQGVTFRDISPLLETQFSETILALAGLFSREDIIQIDAFAGIDARGFIFAAALAKHFNKNFKMVRKAGKIPPPFSELTYVTEYSSCSLQVSDGTGRLVIIDDVLATGGTMTAAADLCEKAGYEIRGLMALIDLPFVHGDSYQWVRKDGGNLKVKSLFSYKTPD